MAAKTKRSAKPSPQPSPKGRGSNPSPRHSLRERGSKAEPPPSGPRPIHVLSDSTGNLGRHVLTAILTQFPADAFRLEMRSFIRSPKQIEDVFQQIQAAPGVVFHGMLDHAHKEQIEQACKKLGIGCCDLTGPFVDLLARTSGITPGRNYELLHRVDEAYNRRVRALEFTLEHDDALGLDTLDRADIVLVGVSRTSKTPTSIYLAQLGYYVANVALAIQVEPPKELLALTGNKVVGLVIDPRTLTEIRDRRREEWRMAPGSSYTDEQEVAREIAWSRKLFNRQGWPVLDVTNQAVEETAARVVHALGLGKGT